MLCYVLFLFNICRAAFEGLSIWLEKRGLVRRDFGCFSDVYMYGVYRFHSVHSGDLHHNMLHHLKRSSVLDLGFERYGFSVQPPERPPSYCPHRPCGLWNKEPVFGCRSGLLVCNMVPSHSLCRESQKTRFFYSYSFFENAVPIKPPKSYLRMYTNCM